MVLTKNINEINKEFDFIDSIVSGIQWEQDNLFDLLITVDYFWEPYKNKSLTLRFKNCKTANFSLPSAFIKVFKAETKNYMHSWYTITGIDYIFEGGDINISIKTIDKDPKWLTLTCEEVWIESIE